MQSMRGSSEGWLGLVWFVFWFSTDPQVQGLQSLQKSLASRNPNVVNRVRMEPSLAIGNWLLGSASSLPQQTAQKLGRGT